MEEATAKSQKSFEANRTPKPGGKPGFMLH